MALILLLQDLKHIKDILEVVFLVFPQYCLGQGIMNMATNYMNAQILLKQGGESLILWRLDALGNRQIVLHTVSTTLPVSQTSSGASRCSTGA